MKASTIKLAQLNQYFILEMYKALSEKKFYPNYDFLKKLVEKNYTHIALNDSKTIKIIKGDQYKDYYSISYCNACNMIFFRFNNINLSPKCIIIENNCCDISNLSKRVFEKIKSNVEVESCDDCSISGKKHTSLIIPSDILMSYVPENYIFGLGDSNSLGSSLFNICGKKCENNKPEYGHTKKSVSKVKPVSKPVSKPITKSKPFKTCEVDSDNHDMDNNCDVTIIKRPSRSKSRKRSVSRSKSTSKSASVTKSKSKSKSRSKSRSRSKSTTKSKPRSKSTTKKTMTKKSVTKKAPVSKTKSKSKTRSRSKVRKTIEITC